ncbi:tripartite tricarboxylate transporter TctB family protein [Ruegeria jejuensis]|uniref:tripartite tricarboxylate transporter TctB family protein n=1 Tax=Ruegeria jejuensis TaxID=3233338 RepID=UPI00355C5B17
MSGPETAPPGDLTGGEHASSPFSLAVSLGVCLLSVVLIYDTWLELNDFNQQAFRVPLGLLVIVALISFAQAVTDFLKLRRSPPSGHALKAGVRVMGFLGLSIAYVLLIPLTGYVPTGVVLSVCAALLAGQTKPLTVVIGALIVPVAIYLAFGLLFSIWLPMGQMFEGS